VKLRKSRDEAETLRKTNQVLNEATPKSPNSQMILGKSQPMKDLMNMVELTAPLLTVLAHWPGNVRALRHVLYRRIEKHGL